MNTSPKIWLISVALGLAAAMSGCVAVVAGAAGAGAVAWVRGELQATVDASFETTARAAKHAIEQLKFARVSENEDALMSTIVARTSDDKKVEIKVSKVADHAAKVQIRVGTFGDESVSLAILDKIKANL